MFWNCVTFSASYATSALSTTPFSLIGESLSPTVFRVRDLAITKVSQIFFPDMGFRSRKFKFKTMNCEVGFKSVQKRVVLKAFLFWSFFAHLSFQSVSTQNNWQLSQRGAQLLLWMDETCCFQLFHYQILDYPDCGISRRGLMNDLSKTPAFYQFRETKEYVMSHGVNSNNLFNCWRVVLKINLFVVRKLEHLVSILSKYLRSYQLFCRSD